MKRDLWLVSEGSWTALQPHPQIIFDFSSQVCPLWCHMLMFNLWACDRKEPGDFVCISPATLSFICPFSNLRAIYEFCLPNWLVCQLAETLMGMNYLSKKRLVKDQETHQCDSSESWLWSAASSPELGPWSIMTQFAMLRNICEGINIKTTKINSK